MKILSQQCIFLLCILSLLRLTFEARATTYYISPEGDDANAGTSARAPWKTLAKVNGHGMQAGDTVLLEGGKTFVGALTFGEKSAGSVEKPITLGSYGKGRATIAPESGTALRVLNAAGFRIRDLILRGDWDGEKQQGSEGCGIEFFSDTAGAVQRSGLRIENVEASGFQKAGIRIGAYPADNSKSGYRDIHMTNCATHGNGDAGIEVYGVFDPKSAGYAHRNLHISRCVSYSNRGVSRRGGHSGNGIVISDVDGAVIERCVAYNNGEFSDYEGGGPVGIWAWEATNVVIQFCESYGNQSATIDGGGFDLDGGVTHSVLQYNYSHDNVGAGYLLAEFGGARPFHHNTVRFNISQNDGRKNGYAGIQFWNGDSGIRDCDIYHNTIFISPSAQGGTPKAVRFQTATTNVRLFNNLFMTAGGLPVMEVMGEQQGLLFQGNAYWTGGAPITVLWNGKTYDSLTAWQTATGQETLNGRPVGLFADPQVTAPGGGPTLGRADRLRTLRAYRLRKTSPLHKAGLDLRALFRLSPGPHDFHENPLPADTPPTIGACAG